MFPSIFILERNNIENHSKSGWFFCYNGFVKAQEGYSWAFFDNPCQLTDLLTVCRIFIFDKIIVFIFENVKVMIYKTVANDFNKKIEHKGKI